MSIIYMKYYENIYKLCYCMDCVFSFVDAVVDYYSHALATLGLTCLTDTLSKQRHQEAGVRLLLTVRQLLWDFSTVGRAVTSAIAASAMFRLLMLDLHAICGDGLAELEARAHVHVAAVSQTRLVLSVFNKKAS